VILSGSPFAKPADAPSSGLKAADCARFEKLMLPHLNAAYNLARWLMRNDEDAEDAVQESYLRAFRYFAGFHGGDDGRSWLLTIVRNTCRTLLQQKDSVAQGGEFDEEKHGFAEAARGVFSSSRAEHDIESLRGCLDVLPAEHREIIVLRELEELSYKEVAVIIRAPIGTVMSRLARARARLRDCIALKTKKVRI
jgi:RNA polymerase sigma-70 factor (ECF subfamily)